MDYIHICISVSSIYRLTVFQFSVLSKSVSGLHRLPTELANKSWVALQVDRFDVSRHVGLAGSSLSTLCTSPQLIK